MLLASRGAALGSLGEQADRDSGALAVPTDDLDLHGVVELVLVEHAVEIVLVLHLLAVDGGDDVADDEVALGRLGEPAQTRGGGRAVRVELEYQQSFVNRQAYAAQVGDGAWVEAELRTDDAPLADELRQDALGDVDGDGEADAHRAAAVGREDLRVDADHAPLRVEQRPAGVARVDRGVGLDGALDDAAVARLDGPLEAGDDAGRQRAVEAERVADGQNLLPDREAVAVGHRHDLQGLAHAGDLEDGEVGVRVAADDARRVGLVAAEADGDLVGALDDVEVGQDVPLVVDDGAGAAAAPSGVEEAAGLARRADRDDAGRDGAEDLDVVLLVGGDRGVRDAGDAGGGRVFAVEGGGRLVQAAAPAVEARDAGRRDEGGKECDGEDLTCRDVIHGSVP